jgi:hypothetical protein
MGETPEVDVTANLLVDRRRAAQQAEKLLWENVEQSFFYPRHSRLAGRARDEEKSRVQEAHWHPVVVEFLTSYAQTLQTFVPDDVHEILQYGGARRLFSIYRAVKCIAGISRIGRQEVLTREEKGAIDDALMLFYVHLTGFFDAIAIAFHRRFMLPTEFEEKSADLLRERLKSLPFPV